MGNSLRCCLACVLPCGALDLIRIVHLNGHVDEITTPVTAGEILKENPGHVLSKPSAYGVDVCRIVIVSPDSELKRGGIYFLIPNPSQKSKSGSDNDRRSGKNSSEKSRSKIDNSDVGRFLAEVVVVAENKSKASRRNRRSRGKSCSWTPQLERICEEL